MCNQRPRKGWSTRFGPGLLVTAAFIGPGTITTATAAGAGFGLALLWVLLFSVVATIVLQEMAARLGIVSRQGLGEALRGAFASPVLRGAVVALVVAAIAFGNAAFQTGNITGAAIGLEVLTGISQPVWAATVGASAIALLATGTYRVIERVLVGLLGVMSLVFLTTAIMARPNVGELLRGLAIPELPDGSLTTCIALIGTTVVPYNLFLHASAVCEKWPSSAPVGPALRESRQDTVIAVALGGLMTLAVVTTAASCYVKGTQIESAAGMAQQLEPLLGRWAESFFAVGLMAAGLTSAITAPLAAAYATAGALGWQADLRSARFRAVWAIIVIAGMSFSIIGTKPVSAIIFAQAANGIILPVIAVFLLIVMNQKSLLGRYANGVLANLLGALVVLIVAGLASFKLWQVVQRIAA